MSRNSTRDITQQRLLLSDLPEYERKLVITIMVRTKWATDNFLTVAGRIRENKQLHRGIAKRYLRECCTICENVQEWIKATAMHSAEWETIQDACLALNREICGKSVYHVNLLKQLRDSLIDFSDQKHSDDIKSIMAEFGSSCDMMNRVTLKNAVDIYHYRPITYMARMGGYIVFNIPCAQHDHSATYMASFTLVVKKLSIELCKNADIRGGRRDHNYVNEIIETITKILGGDSCHIVQFYDAALDDNADKDYILTVNMEKRRRFLRDQHKKADKRLKFADAFEAELEESKYGPQNGEGFEEYKLRVLGSAKEVHMFNLSSDASQRANNLTIEQQYQLDLNLLKNAEKNGVSVLQQNDLQKIEETVAFMKMCEYYFLKDIPPITPRTLRTLASHGLTTVADIIKRKASGIKALKGVGPKTWANIVEGFDYLSINIDKDDD